MKLTHVLLVVSLLIATSSVLFAQRPSRPGTVVPPPPPINTTTNTVSPR